MEHSFNVEVAKAVGVNAAVILNNLRFWIAKNKANEVHFHDGKYWTYNSVRAFSELFPYLTKKQIGTALKKLVDCGYVETGHFGDNKYDRTLWYAITDKGMSLFNGDMQFPEKENDIFPNSNADFTYRENENDTEGKCKYRYKPDSNLTDSKPNYIKGTFDKPTLEDVQAYCDERLNKVDPEQFYDYYESNGWMVGRNKMKDWKAAVRTWERKEKAGGQKQLSSRDQAIQEAREWELEWRKKNGKPIF